MNYSDSIPQNPYKDYKPSIRHIAGIAKGDNNDIRGEFTFLLITLFVFAYTAFDMKFPLFLFSMRHFLSVNNPEPSDFYLIMQRASWVFLPILGVVSMVTGLFLKIN